MGRREELWAGREEPGSAVSPEPEGSVASDSSLERALREDCVRGVPVNLEGAAAVEGCGIHGWRDGKPPGTDL